MSLGEHRPMRLSKTRRQALGTLAACLPAMLLWPPLIWSEETNLENLVRQLARQTSLPSSHIRNVLLKARYTPSIIHRIQQPYESKPYVEYRQLFLTESMRRQGQAFLLKHAEVLQQQWNIYHVEKEIITAILGMESRFGRNTGRDRILDALFTLTTGYPRRSEFFREQLGEFLLLCQEENLDPLAVRGSYAGAFGATQFIPSSFRAYAVDADRDGKRNVWDSVPDITASIAHYFRQHNWRQGRPIACWLPFMPEMSARANIGIKRFSRLVTLKNYLPSIPTTWSDDDEVAIITLQRSTGPAMVLVHRNFYVITRWNRSYNYAMAVAEMASMLGCSHCLGDTQV
ncbi:MAG: lytic murein transglycosylase B [Zetaproteobacteria bacterium]|nr:MAG: lytic murein transglycosylase B [Zetaproteobacteria bacterium]